MARNINDALKINAFEDYMSMQQSKLPQLQDVQHINDRVIRILAGNPGKYQLQGTNTFIVGSGKCRILIDTGQGIPVWASRIAQVVKDEGIELAYVLLTHWHGDHTGGVADLLRLYPDLRSRIHKNMPDAGQQVILDGQKFSVEGATVRAVHTPGHAMDHMCFVLEEETAMFTGDNVLGHGYAVAEDLGTYVNSLGLMQNQNCATGYPAHGDTIQDLGTKMVEYIEQKQRRERQVIRAMGQLGSGGGHQQERAAPALATAAEVARLIHGDLMCCVETVLESLVAEVLWKLAAEKKVAFLMEDGVRKWFLWYRNSTMDSL